MNKKKLDKHFNENVEPDREIFNQISTSEELHYIAENHNWDNGIKVLEWIVDNKLCSEATALMIFWRAQPYDFVKYKYDSKSIKKNKMDYTNIFILIKTIIEKFLNGYFRKTTIKYNPKEDMGEDRTPEIMFLETSGEEPFIYYDKGKSYLLEGEYLNNLLEKCDNSMELYNIVSLLSISILFEINKKIFKHRYCDKGIALFVYWKLEIYNFDRNFVENKIINNEYDEIIKYKPPNNRKDKWNIPEIMKKKIG